MNEADDRKQPVSKRARRASSSGGHDEDESASAAQEPREPQPCMPCHGAGKVISNLGGHARKVTCPWCRGGGIRLIGMDAQEYQQEQMALKRH
jgi:DnaJ-class molecular chaperone